MSRFALLLVAATSLCLSGCASNAAAPVSTYLLGEKLQLGRLSYTVFETQWRTHLGSDTVPRVPQNRFFLVRLAVVNGSSSEITLSNFTIVDDKGTVYDEISNGEGVPQWAGYIRNVKPGDSVQGNVLFDAPPAHYKIQLKDDSGALK